jgi:tRNA modification GTPase
VDTAGIRHGTTAIENAGIERTKTAVEKADIVLVVLDATTELNAFDKYCINLAMTKGASTTKNYRFGQPITNHHIIVYNKTDIATPKHTMTYMPVSAKTGKNINALLDKILELSVQTPPSNGGLVITNERHGRELQNSKDALQSALTADTLDKVSADITTALAHIGAITGTNVNDATLDEIFSKFCLGK